MSAELVVWQIQKLELHRALLEKVSALLANEPGAPANGACCQENEGQLAEALASINRSQLSSERAKSAALSTKSQVIEVSAKILQNVSSDLSVCSSKTEYST